MMRVPSVGTESTNTLEVDALVNCGTAKRHCDAFLILNVFILVLNVLILNMNVLGNVNMMHINVRNSLLGGCRLNKEAGDAASLRLCVAWRHRASQSPICIRGMLT